MKEDKIPHLRLVANNTRKSEQAETKTAREILDLLGRIFESADLISLKHKCDEISVTSTKNTYIGFVQKHKFHFDFLFDSLDNPETLEDDLRMVNVLMMLTYERLMTGKKRLSTKDPTDETDLAATSDPDRLNTLINRLITAICLSEMSVRKASPSAAFNLKEAVNDRINGVLKRN
jgi:hypothetical protein